MSKIGKFFVNILIVAYAVVAVSVTVLLLSYNEYHCSVVGDYTFILVTDDELEPNFEEGSLVIVKETKAKKIEPGDEIFLYRRISTSQFEIKYAEVLLKDSSKGEYDVSYVLEGGIAVDHEDVIGSTEDMVVVPHLGTILSILESRYGYLFLIVVVSFIAFLYEIYELIMEIKYGEKEKEESDYEDEEDDEYDDEYDDDEYDEEEEYEEEVVAPRRKPATKAKTARASSTREARPARASGTREARVATKKAGASKETVKKATKPVAKTAKVASASRVPSKATAEKVGTEKVAARTATAKKATTVKKTASSAKKAEKE